MSLRVLAVDDEAPALADLGRILEQASSVAEVALVNSGGSALRLLGEREFDLVFLDVRMPGLDGLELASVLSRFAEPPAVVFVSAYEDGAVGAFEHNLHPLDYLMKPVSRTRIEQALERVLRGETGSGVGRSALPRNEPSDEIVAVEHQRGGATRLVARSTILFVKAEGDYVRIHAEDGRFLVRTPLSKIEQRFAEHGFVRVHRSYLVNMRRAVEIRPELGGAATVLMADGSQVPVARRQVADLRRRLRT